jgi:hypothetical protein
LIPLSHSELVEEVVEEVTEEEEVEVTEEATDNNPEVEVVSFLRLNFRQLDDSISLTAL